MMGTYIMSQSLIAASMGWKPAGSPPPRTEVSDPAMNSYRTKDGRWLQFSQTYPHLFRAYIKVLGLDWMFDDPELFVAHLDRLGLRALSPTSRP